MNDDLDNNYIHIPGDTFLMGDDTNVGFPSDKEGPAALVTVAPYWIQSTTVTNTEFQYFVDATDYITESEHIGSSFVFSGLEDAGNGTCCSKRMNWWSDVKGANWRHPEGPQSSLQDRMAHPVVHVTWNDAQAYCRWVGSRLPTESEWELAARGGKSSEIYPWGNDLMIKGKNFCNIWQGVFPTDNTREDGYITTAPVKTYEPNGYGTYQMIGNVWEWCLNPAHLEIVDFNRFNAQDFLPYTSSHQQGRVAIRGGSFLCHDSYCNRYRTAARNGNTAHSSSNNTGFRCVKDSP